MSSIINTNINSLSAQRSMSMTQASLATSMQRLSSGLRINSAKDDAAGLGISDRMTSQIRGLNQGVRNANDGISLAQTAEGALSAMTDMMQRMRELAVQSVNGTNGTDDRINLDAEYQTLKTEIDRIGTSTKFNGIAILATATAGAQTFQVGANSGDEITVTTADASTYTTSAGDLLTAAGAKTALGALDTALISIAKDRGTYGAAQNTITFAIQNLQNSSENQSAARSRILDADFAQETANLSRAQILQQAGTAMVAQANQQPQGVLALLR
jgi:flagellin